MKYSLAAALALCLILILPGCSSSKDKPDEEENTDPAPLVSFTPEVKLRQAWAVRVGGGTGKSFERLAPAISGERIFAASADGDVIAARLADGKVVWRVHLKDLYRTESKEGYWSRGDENLVTGGVGAGEGVVVVGTVTGELVALNESDGTLKWRSRTSSEVVSPPQVGHGAIVVQSIDGHVAAYEPADGSRRWDYSAVVPILTLRGTSTPVVLRDVVACGFANGHVVLLDLAQGAPRWDQRVAVAQGQSELERLIDVDGNMAVSNDQLFVAGYQGNLVAIDIDSGQISWAKETSSFTGVGEGFGNVYVAHADGELSAVDMATSRDVWQNDSLRYREITTPVTIGNYVAVGDYAGYVHLFAQADGRLAGRKRADRSGLRSAMLAKENRLYVEGSGGHLVALEVR